MMKAKAVTVVPRGARKTSTSNIYHVMVRGINRQDIFEDDEDRLRFLEVLKECRAVSRFRLYAFCLMSNHVHLLMETGDEPLGQVMKRLGSRYVWWYNQKYGRTGHLFQDRFRSEAVEDRAYFLTVLRYIIRNPMNAGLEAKPGTYRWSSFRAYTGREDAVTDTQPAVSAAGSRDALVAFLLEANDDRAMDDSDFDRRLSDDEARKIMFTVTGCGSAADFQRLDRPLKKRFTKEMAGRGLSMGQIARLTGLSKSTVFSAVH